MFDLWGDIQGEMQAVADHCHQIRNLMVAASEAEGKYRARRAIVFRAYRAQGCSVTEADRLTDGDQSVIKLRTDWKAAEGDYAENNELIMMHKKNQDTLREQYAREWGAVGGQE